MAKELLDLETSFEEIRKLPIASYLVLPINADISGYERKIQRLGFPCWIKLNSPEHKLRLQAVEKCSNFEELKTAYQQLQKKFPGKKFIIQQDVKGAEILAGIKKERTFGKVLLLATGGHLAEVIRDTSFRICPVSQDEILKSLQELKIYKFLADNNLNISRLTSLIQTFSDMDIQEADLNPIIVNEKSAVVVDARVSLPSN